MDVALGDVARGGLGDAREWMDSMCVANSIRLDGQGSSPAAPPNTQSLALGIEMDVLHQHKECAEVGGEF